MIEDDGTTIYEDLVGGAPAAPGGGATGDELYSGLSDGEIEDGDAYSDISSDENFLDSLNDEQRMVRPRFTHACVAIESASCSLNNRYIVVQSIKFANVFRVSCYKLMSKLRISGRVAEY